jgi:hypothetical protein
MRGLLLGTLGVALAYVTAFFPAPVAGAGPWLMAGGILLLVVSLLVLATRRQGGKRPLSLRLGLTLLGLVLAGGFGAAFLLPPETAASPLLLGLPRRAALLIYGVGLAPVLFLPLSYALSFDATVLSEAELREFRRRLAELGAERTR